MGCHDLCLAAEEELDEKQVYEMPEAFEKTLCLLQPEDKVKISYQISLDAPVTLPGCGEMNTSIPARSVIDVFRLTTCV